jgi:hypothetical protein
LLAAGIRLLEDNRQRLGIIAIAIPHRKEKMRIAGQTGLERGLFPTQPLSSEPLQEAVSAASGSSSKSPARGSIRPWALDSENELQGERESQ